MAANSALPNICPFIVRQFPKSEAGESNWTLQLVLLANRSQFDAIGGVFLIVAGVDVLALAWYLSLAMDYMGGI
ncbi:MAG: hypothetical protein VXZ82_18075 [Planctomycetota bacterium]|nr:hypothetical protein [Planctomycetota bacterium]